MKRMFILADCFVFSVVVTKPESKIIGHMTNGHKATVHAFYFIILISLSQIFGHIKSLPASCLNSCVSYQINCPYKKNASKGFKTLNIDVQK